MGVFKSVIRFITTLGGLLSSSIDEGTDSLVSTPAGVKAAFRQTRDQWTKQYQEIRDAVSQLMMVMEQKREEIQKLEKEQDDLETKKRGAVEKFRQTKDVKYQNLFSDFHSKLSANETRLATLSQEVEGMEGQLNKYKLKLTEMQTQIADLDRQEAEAIADIVSSKQIVALNDRLSNVSTSLHDENLQAIEKQRSRLKAKAKLSDELAGTDKSMLEAEVLSAGMSGDAMDEFNQMLQDSDLKNLESSGTENIEKDRIM